MQDPMLTDELQKLSKQLETQPSESGFRSQVQHILSLAVKARPVLDLQSGRPKTDGYERFCLYSNSTLSAWALLWAPSAQTPIHDHHCWCGFAVACGSFEETRFEVGLESEIRMTDRIEHGTGSSQISTLTDPNIHRLANSGTTPAVSIHLYGFDGSRKTSSIRSIYDDRENR